MPDPINAGQRLINRLSIHLGPNVAKMAVSDFSQKSLGKKMDAVKPADLQPLLNAMRPMLSVLLGKDHTDVIIQEMGRETP